MDLKKSFATALNRPDMLGDSRFGENKINDIPIMITQDGTVVCIKKREEVSSIVICGSSGSGKTICLHNICDHLFYQWCENVALMNDIQGETLSWSEPQEVHKFIVTMNRLNLKPTPLPMVYVYPSTNDLVLNDELLKYKDYVKVSLPLNELLDNLGFYFKAVCPEFELGGSTIYAEELLPEFKTKDNPEDILNVIDSIPEIKAFKMVKQKIRTAFNRIFNEGILRVTCPDSHAFVEVEKFKSNPMTTIMYANGIPSLMTANLRNKKYKNAVIAYYINSVFNSHELEEFNGKNIYMIFDELTTICSSEDKENNPAKAAIINLVARGRINRVGIVLSTQAYTKIPSEIKASKMNYIIAFKSIKDNAKQIVSDFSMPESMELKLKKLKTFECIAATTDKFVCYKEGKKWESNEVFIGQVIPPCSNHKWI